MRLFVTGNRVRCDKTENSKTDESHKDSSNAGALNTITKFFETVNAREKHVLNKNIKNTKQFGWEIYT